MFKKVCLCNYFFVGNFIDSFFLSNLVSGFMGFCAMAPSRASTATVMMAWPTRWSRAPGRCALEMAPDARQHARRGRRRGARCCPRHGRVQRTQLAAAPALWGSSRWGDGRSRRRDRSRRAPHVVRPGPAWWSSRDCDGQWAAAPCEETWRTWFDLVRIDRAWDTHFH